MRRHSTVKFITGKLSRNNWLILRIGSHAILRMDTKQTRVYHIVQFRTTLNIPLSNIHCVPASWIKGKSQESAAALVAYPDEPWEITREWVKNYESPREDWNLYLAQIKYTTDFYDSAIRGLNERERSVEESSASLQASRSSEMSYSKAFCPESNRWFDKQPNSDDLRLSMTNRIDEVISLDSGISDEEDVDRNDNDVPLDLSVKRLYKPAYNSFRTSSDTSESWTLKHREYKPGLIELLSNTGIYIGLAELGYCLKHSHRCTKLARLLTMHIFSESALRTCLYINNIKGQRDLRLSTIATAAIVKFVQMYGELHNWDKSNMYDIKSAMRHQLALCKHKQ